MELQRETGEELVGFENAEEEEKFNKETIKKLEGTLSFYILQSSCKIGEVPKRTTNLRIRNDWSQ